MDMGNPVYLNKTPKQILSELNVSIQEDCGISEDNDEFILEQMADIYVYMQWRYNLPSAEIAEKTTPESLYQKYYPLHETSEENGVRKLLSMQKQYREGLWEIAEDLIENESELFH